MCLALLRGCCLKLSIPLKPDIVVVLPGTEGGGGGSPYLKHQQCWQLPRDVIMHMHTAGFTISTRQLIMIGLIFLATQHTQLHLSISAPDAVSSFMTSL